MNDNINTDTFITKLILNDTTIYLKFLWKCNEDDLFHIRVYEGDQTWSGRYPTDVAEKYRECFDETPSEYMDNIKECVSGNSDLFTYSFSKNSSESDCATFVWKKKFIGSTATRIHGTVSLQLDPIPDSKDNLIDYLLSENKKLQQTVADVNDKTKIVTEELDLCKSEMESYIDIKNKLESELYGKFLLLLNSKKRRIQLLEENLQKFTQEKDDEDSRI